MATLSLVELSALFPASPEVVDAMFADVDEQMLATLGRKVSSERVLTDVSRLYGIAAELWSASDAAQRDALIGFSDDLLGVAVAEALRLQAALESFARRVDDDRAVREVTAAELGDAWGDAMRMKLHAEKALASVVGGRPARMAELARATGRTDDPDELGRRLDDLVALVRRCISDPALALRARVARIDQAYVGRIEVSALRLRAAADAARARRTAIVSQGDLDLLDGRNLYLLRLVADVFDQARRLDPSVPRLVPIATATALGRRRPARKPVPSDTATEPVAEPEIRDAFVPPSAGPR